MSAPGNMDELGVSHNKRTEPWGWETPTVPTGGTNRDVGSLALMLIANWFINGEYYFVCSYFHLLLAGPRLGHSGVPR